MLLPKKIFQRSISIRWMSKKSSHFYKNHISGDDLFTNEGRLLVNNSSDGNSIPNSNIEAEPHFTPFNDYIEARRQATKRSVLVQVKSQDTANDLIAYCGKQFGTPKSLHYHTNVNSEVFKNFFIVEFETSDIVDEIIMNHARHKSDSNDHFPVCSPFLWLSQEKQT